MLAKRVFDLIFSSLGILLLLPLFWVVAIWIKFDSNGPIFFRQERVGKSGRKFRIFKFRTMCLDAESKGRQITVGEDSRITRSGRFLRRNKMDELPQLINVFLGEMSLVGPRPEVPRYVAHYPPEVRERVLSVPPGITDYASIEYRDESALLAGAADPEKTYVEKVLPIKLGYYEDYALNRTLYGDLLIIIRTVIVLLSSK